MANPDTAEIEKVTRVLKARMASIGLSHLDRVNVRTGTVLEVAGLFRRTDDPNEDAELSRVILETRHPRRVATDDGPILFYRDGKETKKQFALDMRLILLSPNRQLREAAFAHFVKTDPESLHLLGPKTSAILQANRNALIADDPDVWQPAALLIHDAVDTDIVCQIAGLSQSLRERYEDGLQYYIPRLLRPSVAAFECLGLRFDRPTDQGELIAAEVEALVERASSVEVACTEYRSILGALPLAGALSFNSMVLTWSRRHGNPADLWNNVWAWSRGAGPAAQFYGCCFLLEELDAIPSDLYAELAKSSIEILVAGAGEPQSEADCYWRISQELAQHYLRHFEISAPGALGEPLAIWSSWLAQNVSEVLCKNVTAALHIRTAALLPEIGRLELEWRLANAPLAGGPASMATREGVSPWQLALIGFFGRTGEALKRLEFTGQQCETMEDALVKCIVLWSPVLVLDESNVPYLFQINLAKAAAGLTGTWPSSEKLKFLSAVSQTYSQLTDPQAALDGLKEIANASEADQAIIANATRLLSVRGELPLGPTWDMLSDGKWRAEATSKVSAAALEMLFIAFAAALRAGGEQWKAGLPHLYADACEGSVGDKERLELLSFFVVLCCIHAYSVGALERLLSGPRRPELIEIAQQWKARLLEIMQSSSPWVAARVRAVIAAISAAI